MTTLAAARHAWSTAQHLHRSSTQGLAELVASTGWLRTLGGAEAYVAMKARRPSTSAAEVHAAVEAGDLQVLPSVRGCIYLVPRADAALALSTSRMLDGRRFTRDIGKAGTSMEELADVGAAVLDALSGGPLSTHQLRKALPDGALRSLGPAGKKVGLSSTLPPALRQLEWTGVLARRPHDHRIDHETYVWMAQPEVAGLLDSEEQVARALAERFWRWTGLATVDGFVAWSGLGKRLARAAVSSLELETVLVEGQGDYLRRAGAAAEASGELRVLGGLDNLTAYQESAGPFVAPEHHHREVNVFARKGSAPIGERSHLYERLLFRDGEIVGAWAWRPEEARAFAVGLGEAAPPDAEEALHGVQALLEELGHGRGYGMDTDERLLRRVAIVEALGA